MFAEKNHKHEGKIIGNNNKTDLKKCSYSLSNSKNVTLSNCNSSCANVLIASLNDVETPNHSSQPKFFMNVN